MKDPKDYYFLDPAHTDQARVKREREKAKKLRQTGWWKQKIQGGRCHYCEQKFDPDTLTMDHVVPIARGGTSTQGNVVPACTACNSSKNLETPAERILKQLAEERQARGAQQPAEP